MGCEFAQWRIGLSEPSLANQPFFVVRLPVPALCEYRRYGQQRVRTDGSTTTHGFGVAEITWDSMDQAQMARITRFVEDARASTGQLFMTIDAGDGLSLGDQFVDVVGFTNAIEQRKGGPLHLSLSGAHYDSVTIMLRNVAELSRPSMYS